MTCQCILHVNLNRPVKSSYTIYRVFFFFFYLTFCIPSMISSNPNGRRAAFFLSLSLYRVEMKEKEKKKARENSFTLNFVTTRSDKYSSLRSQSSRNTHRHTIRRERKQTTPYLEWIVDSDTSITICSSFHIV